MAEEEGNENKESSPVTTDESGGSFQPVDSKEPPTATFTPLDVIVEEEQGSPGVQRENGSAEGPPTLPEEVSLLEDIKDMTAAGESVPEPSLLPRFDDTGGEGGTQEIPRRISTQSDFQALTTAQILDRLNKAYEQACKTLAVIGSVQRRESVLKLEEHQMELLRKFTKFESHLDELELVRQHSTQTSKTSCSWSVPTGTPILDSPIPQDILPQVLICGRQERVPRVVVCENEKSKFQAERERLLKTQKDLVRKFECMRKQLILKETTIDNLQRQICTLRRNNCTLTKQLCQCQSQAEKSQLKENVCPLICQTPCGLTTTPNDDNGLSDKESSVAVCDCIPKTQQKEQQRQKHIICSGKSCSTKCPNFRPKLCKPKDNSQTEGTMKGACFKMCPSPETKEQTICGQKYVMKSTEISQCITDEDIENTEIEIKTNTLCSCEELPLHDKPGHVEGKDLTERGLKAHNVMKHCPKMAERQPKLCELNKDCECLKRQLEKKIAELEDLRKDIVEHKEIAERACVAQQQAEIELKNLGEKLKLMEDKNLMVLVPKERIMELEQQIVVAKDRFLESQDELEDLREIVERQATELEEYKRKFLKAHEQVEDQKGQIDMLETENNRINENVELEIQHVKNEFELRLQALSPLPDVLKTTQEKLQDLQEQLNLNEQKYQDMEKELEEARQKVKEYSRLLNGSSSGSNVDVEGQGSVRKQLAKCEKRCEALEQQITELKRMSTVSEETANTYQARLLEKLHEVAQLTATMELLRTESARQVARAKERLETARRGLQAQIIELEAQVAQSRAVARTARKDRDHIRERMQAQIGSLNLNLEQAQVTIRTLQEQVGFFNNSTCRTN